MWTNLSRNAFFTRTQVREDAEDFTLKSTLSPFTTISSLLLALQSAEDAQDFTLQCSLSIPLVFETGEEDFMLIVFKLGIPISKEIISGTRSLFKQLVYTHILVHYLSQNMGIPAQTEPVTS